jgi:hypothetical protein
VLDILGKSKQLVAAALFALCIAPTFISYQPYVFSWDDSEYLRRSIVVSRTFWSWNVHGVAYLRAIGAGMYSIRPPAMTLLGLPWGPLASWDAAGKCFITLAALISLLVASCLYLLLRIGVKPLFLVIASVCVVASIGPYLAGATAHASADPLLSVHPAATAFLADSLFAWTTLAALLLIPYEARTYSPSIRGALVRGILWGSILSLGVITKVNFFYFIVLIVPTLFVIRLRHGGLRGAFAALIALAGWSAPAAIYLVRHGRPAFENGKASSFGPVANFYYRPLLQFLGNTIRESPGFVLSFALTAAALAYLVFRKRTFVREPDFLALVIMIGFGVIVLATPNRQIRYAFPAIVTLPFLIGILMSGRGHSVPGRSAALAAGLVFCTLLAAGVPTRHRADRQKSLGRSDAVLAQAVGCNAERILLATDSPTLSQDLMRLAIAVSASGASVEVDTLAYKALLGEPIEEDFRAIRESDLVVFQDKDALSPPFTNQRASEYERYTRQQDGYVPIRVGDDISVYPMHCRKK